jgi:hypothetical protein
MKSYKQAVLWVGIVAPILMISAVLAGVWTCVGIVNKVSLARENNYAIYLKYQQQIKSEEAEIRFLKEQLPVLKSVAEDQKLENFVQQIKTASTSVPGIDVLDTSTAESAHVFYGPNSKAINLKIEGLSGHIISVLGTSFRDNPAIFADSWKIEPTPNQHSLIVQLTAVLSKRDQMQ